jgi:hypothetical protein
MAVPVHTSSLDWARVHRAALAIVILCMALAVAGGLLAARAISGGTPAPVKSVATVHLPAAQNPCEALGRPGRPRPC